MSCTPQLHLYDHMPENRKKVEVTDVNKVASRADSSPAEMVKATATNQSIWRWTLAVFLNPINTPQSSHDVDASARSVQGTNQLPGVWTDHGSSLTRDFSAGLPRTDLKISDLVIERTTSH